MTAAILKAPVDSLVTTDGKQRGCEAPDLLDLTTELTTALNGAIWSYLLRAELEEAFDTALLRAAIAETPTFSGAGLFAA
jgi:hypothetical protein